MVPGPKGNDPEDVSDNHGCRNVLVNRIFFAATRLKGAALRSFLAPRGASGQSRGEGVFRVAPASCRRVCCAAGTVADAGKMPALHGIATLLPPPQEKSLHRNDFLPQNIAPRVRV